MLLGRQVPVAAKYTPELLYPISRSTGRAALGLGTELPFNGVDVWHAYELSWLDAQGKPVSRLGRLTVPADSTNLVESKSLKLYLNSLNNMRYDSDEQVAAIIRRDLAAVLGADVELELFSQQDPAFAGQAPPGQCLDQLPVADGADEPDASLLLLDNRGEVEEQLFSHLLRSLCPVTGQPDWATLWISYRGPAIDHASLLRYIIAFRRHQEFHEQCVERVFCDIIASCKPTVLTVQALYTRRGGLDICPLRTTLDEMRSLPRMDRQ